MIIKINGKDECVEKSRNLAELIVDKKLQADKIVIEHNLRIVPQEEWQQILLRDSDQVEIVSFVGGG